eukprot:1147111-Pelagomonas_calceolata.AAC.2
MHYTALYLPQSNASPAPGNGKCALYFPLPCHSQMRHLRWTYAKTPSGVSPSPPGRLNLVCQSDCAHHTPYKSVFNMLTQGRTQQTKSAPLQQQLLKQQPLKPQGDIAGVFLVYKEIKATQAAVLLPACMLIEKKRRPT